MKELLDKIEDLKAKVKDLESKIDLQAKEREIKSLEAEMNEPGFWDDQKRATWISKKVADLKEEIADWQKLNKEVSELLEFAKEDHQDQSVNFNKEIQDRFFELKRFFSKIELVTMMNNKYDADSAVLAIYAGAGGDDAQDWAEMLLRMYLRFFESKNWQANIIDQSKGTEVGVKSVVIEVKGNYVYGYLKAEAGVHRLVRLSPFDADHARHTSFALVEVIPEIEQDSEIEMKQDDLKVDVFRASGHGGQSVNTTDSAVRITHLPTGIKVVCQNERSQHQNKETALKYLKGKLLKYYEAKLEEERQALKGQFTEASWGNQIRSYVLHPYKMVKDHRTDYEESDPQKVLDGEIENFIQEYLTKK
ncbi:peptide chain release factor 2 [Patescibacteria group bacterium]|nr:peptide chain release factor 2 [Patescibacteria group bacterium]